MINLWFNKVKPININNINEVKINWVNKALTYWNIFESQFKLKQIIEYIKISI